MKVQINLYQTTRSNFPGDIIFICDRIVLKNCKSFVRGCQQIMTGTSAVQYCVSPNEEMVNWSHGQMVKWSNGRMVKWSHGQMVKWSNDQMVKWSHDQMVTWSNGHMVKWSNGHMVKWSNVHMVKWTNG